jgi:hypothetical protein
LDGDEQQSVSQLLHWFTGSSSGLNVALHKTGLTVDSTGSLLCWRLQKALDGRASDFIGHPPITTWLALRPAGTAQSCLIIDISVGDPTPVRCERYLQALLVHTEGLDRLDVQTRIYLADPGRLITESVPDIPLRWSITALRYMLSLRVQRAQGKQAIYTTFSGLFFNEPYEQVDTALAEAAQGSLQKMLTLGRAIIQCHISSTPDQPGLHSQDFDRMMKGQKGQA